jgi:uncharacterized protein with GYD domain
MPKFLIQASYTPEGLRGLAKDKASGRQKAIAQALASVGGKLEAVYYAFGDIDVFIVADYPDNISAAAVSLTVSAAGLVQSKTIPLLSIEEVDLALGKKVTYRSPGA